MYVKIIIAEVNTLSTTHLSVKFNKILTVTVSMDDERERRENTRAKHLQDDLSRIKSVSRWNTCE